MPRLSDEESVERIPVMRRKGRDGESMVGRQPEHAQTRANDMCVKVVRHRELSNGRLHPDLSE